VALPLRIDWFHLRKTFDSYDPSRRSLDDSSHQGLLDFSASIRNGITVILGPKGAGKTTLLRLTAMLSVPDDGRIIYQLEEQKSYVWSKGNVIADSSSLVELKEKVSYVPVRVSWEQDMTVENAFLYQAQLKRVIHPRKKSAEMVAKWGLAGFRRSLVSELSRGVFKRFLLAHSLLANPTIWILDEPTEGLDELGKKLLWRELRSNPENRIILIATEKDMQLAEAADDLVLMEAGVCRRIGKKKYLAASVPEGTVAAWYQAMQAFSNLRHFK
jgi:ABC-2 type transport system ATP-binding protein